MKTKASHVLDRLHAQANPEAVSGMARFGIQGGQVLGIKIPVLRKMAREIGRDHDLAQALWESGVHEARLLTAFVDDPKQVSEAQMERWVADFDSWDVCDQVCSNLFDRTPYAYDKAAAWTEREAEFIRRAGFAMMAALAVHDKKAPDSAFEAFLPLIAARATDGRNFVKKAVNWALRQIGKRNRALNHQAIRTAESIAQLDSPSARWVASDALRELRSEKVQKRLA